MDIMVVNPEIRVEKRSNFRIITMFSVILKTDPEPQPTTGNAKIRKGNKIRKRNFHYRKRDAATKKQGLKFFRQL